MALPRARRFNLLVTLLAADGKRVEYQRLVDEAWPEHPPADSRNALQAQISRLRRDLRSWGFLAQDVSLASCSPGYVLAVDQGVVDFLAFEHQATEVIRSARAGGDQRSVMRRAAKALSLWRGTPMAGWELGMETRILRSQWEELRLSVERKRLECALSIGDFDFAVPELLELCERNPLNETFHRQLSVALFRSGRQAHGLHVHREFGARLMRELGVRPTRKFRSALTDLLRESA
ncbi:AfsR/SARP family transcriptional regulator [Streptomyces sp. NPDC054796]